MRPPSGAGLPSDGRPGMTGPPVERLLWQGRESVDRCAALLLAGRGVELQLPRNFNHSLFAALQQPSMPQAELLDVTGGPDMLARIAGVGGLEDLRRLETPARGSGSSVRVVSPALLMIGPDVETRDVGAASGESL